MAHFAKGTIKPCHTSLADFALWAAAEWIRGGSARGRRVGPFVLFKTPGRPRHVGRAPTGGDRRPVRPARTIAERDRGRYPRLHTTTVGPAANLVSLRGPARQGARVLDGLPRHPVATRGHGFRSPTLSGSVASRRPDRAGCDAPRRCRWHGSTFCLGRAVDVSSDRSRPTGANTHRGVRHGGCACGR